MKTSLTAYNSGHTVTLRSAQIRQSRTLHARKTLPEIGHKGADKNE